MLANIRKFLANVLGISLWPLYYGIRVYLESTLPSNIMGVRVRVNPKSKSKKSNEQVRLLIAFDNCSALEDRYQRTYGYGY